MTATDLGANQTPVGTMRIDFVFERVDVDVHTFDTNGLEVDGFAQINYLPTVSPTPATFGDLYDWDAIEVCAHYDRWICQAVTVATGVAVEFDATVHDGSAYQDPLPVSVVGTTNPGEMRVDVIFQAANAAPEANAGTDQVVCSGDEVTLDGSGSTDADQSSSTLGYAWEEVNANGRLSGQRPKYFAPSAPVGGVVQTWQLTVTDAEGLSDTSSVNVNVKHANVAPRAEIVGAGKFGPELEVSEGAEVTLDGSPSYDPDSDAIGTYMWTQTFGPSAMIVSTGAKLTFDAPALAGANPDTTALLVFTLEVVDRPDDRSCGVPLRSQPVEYEVLVHNVNHAPASNAGLDALVSSATSVVLTGSGIDPDSDPLTYSWRQVSGPTVTLLNPGLSTTSFTSPMLAGGATATLVFELTVSDGYLAATDTVTITARGVNAPPDCSKAVAAGDLWPPNHKLVAIGISGVTDPDDPTHVVVTKVFQDEPVEGLGDGDTPIDAIIAQGGSVLIRAERAGNPKVPGNGRVYHVTFENSDGRGGTCSGKVTLCVPADQGGRSKCIDGGPLYDSTKRAVR